MTMAEAYKILKAQGYQLPPERKGHAAGIHGY